MMWYDVVSFHVTFGLEYDGPPRCLTPDLFEFRYAFMAEELKEYEDAYIAGDLEGQFDALIDLAYVVLGTAHMHGFNFPVGWTRVHDANMKKVRVKQEEDSKRGSTYDVVKPPGWEAPDLSDLV